MNEVIHRLVGYDRRTGELVTEYDIPTARLDFAKRTACVGPDDPGAVLCYKLTRQQARDIAGAIGAAVDVDALNFYMEGFTGSGQPIR